MNACITSIKMTKFGASTRITVCGYLTLANAEKRSKVDFELTKEATVADVALEFICDRLIDLEKLAAASC